MTYHDRKNNTAYFRQDINTCNKRQNREYTRKHRPEKDHELQKADAERKRNMRTNMCPQSMVVERKKDADRKWVQRHALAAVYPEDHDYVKSRHAKQERERQAAECEQIRETKRLNNRMRMRADRKGKVEYDYVDINKVRSSLRAKSDVVKSPEPTPRRRYRRSPETRKNHAAQERKRVASLSPNTAAKAKQMKTKRKREWRASKSEVERRRERQKNAARMRTKRNKSILHEDQSSEPVRKYFSINWKSTTPYSSKMNYYTVINGQEYFQYKMHSLMI